MMYEFRYYMYLLRINERPVLMMLEDAFLAGELFVEKLKLPVSLFVAAS